MLALHTGTVRLSIGTMWMPDRAVGTLCRAPRYPRQVFSAHPFNPLPLPVWTDLENAHMICRADASGEPLLNHARGVCDVLCPGTHFTCGRALISIPVKVFTSVTYGRKLNIFFSSTMWRNRIHFIPTSLLHCFLPLPWRPALTYFRHGMLCGRQFHYFLNLTVSGASEKHAAVFDKLIIPAGSTKAFWALTQIIGQMPD